MGAIRFTQLDVWREAHELVLAVYRTTAGFPQEERYGLVPQMRRAAVSVPANIAEGFKRRGRADKVRFYNISEASLEELRYYFILCRDFSFPIAYRSLDDQADKVARLLFGLTKSVAN